MGTESESDVLRFVIEGAPDLPGKTLADKVLNFVIPGPPVPWARTGGNGKKRYTPAKVRNFKQSVGWIARQACGKGTYYPTAEALSLIVKFYLPDRRVRDLDNLVKGVKDAMTGIVWNDDSQVCCELLSKAVDRDRPRTEVCVFRYEAVLARKAEFELGHGILSG